MADPSHPHDQPRSTSRGNAASASRSEQDGLLTCGEDGSILDANPEAERLTGRARPSLVGLPVGEVLALSPEAVAQWREAARCGRSRPAPPALTVELRTPAGRFHTCQVVFVACREPRSGPAALFFVRLRDMSELTVTRGRLFELKARQDALVERSDDVIFEIRPNLHVVSVNPAIGPVMGYAPSELVGTRLDLPRFLPSEEMGRFRQIGARTLMAEGIRRRLFQIKRKGGDLFWGLLTVTPIRRGRSTRAFIGILRDVSEFYEALEQLEMQHAQLKETLSRLESSNRIQEEFVANVTHELRTPLTTLIISSELLDRGAGGDFSPSQRRQVELIRKNSKILLEIINDLLDVAKLKRNGYQLSVRDIHLRKLAADLVDEMDPLFVEKGLYLRLEIAPETPDQCRSDPAVLRKIVTNILSNAFKFTETGGALLTIGPHDGGLAISVTDTGIGISEEELPRIFEEFRQVDGSDSRRYPGTGLGLSIVERFAALLGGRIEVSSHPGKGSTFTVLLPLKPGDPTLETKA